jgi:hypothetical protein
MGRECRLLAIDSRNGYRGANLCRGVRQRTRPDRLADFIFAYADWLSAHLEEWTVTTKGELIDGFPRHYVRINPTDALVPDPHADPNTTMIQSPTAAASIQPEM